MPHTVVHNNVNILLKNKLLIGKKCRRHLHYGRFERQQNSAPTDISNVGDVWRIVEWIQQSEWTHLSWKFNSFYHTDNFVAIGMSVQWKCWYSFHSGVFRWELSMKTVLFMFFLIGGDEMLIILKIRLWSISSSRLFASMLTNITATYLNRCRNQFFGDPESLAVHFKIFFLFHYNFS